MWQTFTYYAALALESVVGVFGIRLYEEPRCAVEADRARARMRDCRLPGAQPEATAAQIGPYDVEAEEGRSGRRSSRPRWSRLARPRACR